MTTKETPKEFADRILLESRVDIDLDYCKKHGIKFNDNENNCNEVEPFNSKSNRIAFDFVNSKTSKINKLPRHIFRMQSFFKGLEDELFYNEEDALKRAEIKAKSALQHINSNKNRFEYRQYDGNKHEIKFKDQWGVKRFYTILQGNGDPVMLAEVVKMKIK